MYPQFRFKIKEIIVKKNKNLGFNADFNQNTGVLAEFRPRMTKPGRATGPVGLDGLCQASRPVGPVAGLL